MEIKTFDDLYKESKLYEQSLKETTYNWNIDPNERSWFITPRGDLWGDMSHRLMLKNKFNEKWNDLKLRRIDDGEIEEIFTKSLIQSSYVKIGELNDFYVIVYKLDNRIKDTIQGFCLSILKTREVSNSLITIHISSETIKSTIGEVSNGFLFSLRV